MILDYTIITHVAVVPLQSLVPDFIFLGKKKLNSFKGKREKKILVLGIAILFGNTFLKTPKPPHSYLLCSFFSIVPLPKSQVTHLHTTFYVIHFWLQLVYFHTMINLLC